MIRLEEALRLSSPRNGAYPTICVDGRGASGKTTLAEFLAVHLEGLTVVHGDDYFEPHDGPVTWGRFNEARFDSDVLSRVRVGDRDIPLRPFDFPNRRVSGEQVLTITRGLVIERWLSMSLDVPWDIAIWVDAPPLLCLERGLAREDAALGERARLAWETVWQPREARYIEEMAPVESADFVVDGTSPFEDQFGFDVR
ncbi:MAG: hypothetical protein M0Z98_09880 [Actinomycetales bacterium]|nr:hypothetical protein [Actinomycetales bacterium]